MSHQLRLRRGSAALAMAASLAIVAACGGEEGGGTTEAGEDFSGTISVAHTSPVQANYVAADFGAFEYGPDLGLDISEDDFTTFDSHAVATQTVLSGEADVVAGSFVSTLLLIDQGQDFKSFCPYISQDDFVIAGANGVDTIEQLFEEGTLVAMDSPGGAGSVIFDAMLQALGETRTTADMPGQQILESSGLRLSAFAAGEVDATVIHEPQFAEAEPQVQDPVVIATLYKEVDGYLKETQAAPGAWLDENSELAARYCATTLLGMQALKEDFDLFVQATQEHAEAGPMEEEELRGLHELINEYPFWPHEDGGLDEETVSFMSEVAVKSGLIDEAPAYEDVVDREVLDRALELVEEHNATQ